MTRSRQLTITSMGADGPAGTRSSIRSRPSAATSNVGGCPPRMNDFSNSTTGALYAVRDVYAEIDGKAVKDPGGAGWRRR